MVIDYNQLGMLRTNPDSTPQQLYLELLKFNLTAMLRPRETENPEIPEGRGRRAALRLAQKLARSSGNIVLKEKAVDLEHRFRGVEHFPWEAETMVGIPRLDNIQFCGEKIIEDGIPGDFIETGVWKGGSVILMAAILAAYQQKDRSVWVADSFQGLPKPDDKYPADRGDMHYTYPIAVSQPDVMKNFEKYGLLSPQVKFLPGWFKDTLHVAPIEKLALMRLDGDMYGSTWEAIEALYPKLSPGGFVLVDDYLWHRPCAQAIDDYREKHNITEPIQEVDFTGVYWRKDR